MKRALLIMLVFCCSWSVAVGAELSGGVIRFDDVAGETDADKLKNLPDMIAAKVVDFGTKYSQGGDYPQPGFTHTMLKVIFSSRSHDFRALTEPVDMGHSFEFCGEGAAVFECGKNGFIRFSQYQATFRNLYFLGPKDNVPPLLVYNANVEPREWQPVSDEQKKLYFEAMQRVAGASTAEKKKIRSENGEALWAGFKKLEKEKRARGIHQDGGRIIIDGCIFKGLGVCMRTRFGHAVDPSEILITNTRFYHIAQISDWYMSDHMVITGCWICPSIESDRAVFVSVGGLYFHGNILVPLSTRGPFTNCRWFDNYGWGMTIADNRFGNENINWKDVLLGEQIAVVYNYKRYGEDWVNADGTWKLTGDRHYIIIRDNLLYCRNMPVLTCFEIPNMVTITGNCGGGGRYVALTDKTSWNGKTYPRGTVIDRTCWLDFKCQMPELGDCRYISFDISNNLRAVNVTRDNPKLLPVPLRYCCPSDQGTVARGRRIIEDRLHR